MAALQAPLVALGLPAAGPVPAGSNGIVIAKVQGVEHVQGEVRALRSVAYALPVVALVAFGLAVALARRRRLVMGLTGVCVVVDMLALALVLRGTCAFDLDKVTGVPLDDRTAGLLFDTLARFLSDSIWVLPVAGVVVVALAWLAGRPSVAQRLRCAHA